MSEQQSEKKVVIRNVAIALGIVCIVLALGLVGAIADYVSMINDKNNIINDKNNIIDDKNTTIASLDSQISDLNGSNEYLQNQVDCLYNITNLKNKLSLGNGTVAPTEFMKETIGIRYSGYVIVRIEMPTPNSTTLRVTWSSSGTNYDKTVNVGKNTIMVFPVLPTNVTITVEHANMFTEEEVYY